MGFGLVWFGTVENLKAIGQGKNHFKNDRKIPVRSLKNYRNTLNIPTVTFEDVCRVHTKRQVLIKNVQVQYVYRSVQFVTYF